jgi:Spy/CpxP family protein refolding chaperone
MRIQKLTVIAALALGGLVASVNLCSAQDANAKDANAKEGKKGPRGGGMEQRFERLSTELNLTEAQKPKVKAAFEDQMKKMQGLRDTPREERRDKMREIREEQNKKMKEILTAEQFDKYKKLQEEMRQRRQGGPGAPQGGADTKSGDKKTQ